MGIRKLLTEVIKGLSCKMVEILVHYKVYTRIHSCSSKNTQLFLQKYTAVPSTIHCCSFNNKTAFS